MLSRCRTLARFQTPSEHETLVSSLILSRRLKRQIDLFSHYRKLGLRSLDDAREYEVRRRRREQELRLKRSKQGLNLDSLGPSYQSTEILGVGNTSRFRAITANDQINSKIVDEAAAIRTLGRDTADGAILSRDELELCHRAGILPNHYLTIQAALVR